MKTPITILAFILLGAAAGSTPTTAQDTPPPAAATAPATPATPPCSADEHRHFDFWIGEWEVKDGAGKVLGSNRIEKILNGCVLLENWEGAQGSIGKSFNMYFARDTTWRQTWVDGNGGRLDLTGGLDGADMVLRGETARRDGGTNRHEIRWTPLADGRVRQHWRTSTDSGETWQDAFLGFYEKR